MAAMNLLDTLDPNVKQRRASDPEASVWVAASAGSGKTKVLTDRVLRLMLAGTPPHRILCLTFTKAAAAEMANRVNGTLAKWATADDAALEDMLANLNGARPHAAARTAARRLFARVVDCPGGMKIQTIHAFCQSLLRRFPLEAGLVPHFEVMDDRTSGELLTEARDQVLQKARMRPDSPLGLALNRLAGEVPQDDFHDLIAELASERGRLKRIFARHDGLEGTIAAVRAHLGVAEGETEESILAGACADDAIDAPALREACRALSLGSDSDRDRGGAVQHWLDAAERRIEAFHAYRRLFLTAENAVRKTLITKKAATAAAVDALAAEAARLVEVLARLKPARVAVSTAALLTLAEALLGAYETAKDARALLDFDDLILATARLLDTAGVASWVLFKLDGGLDHILIDEAQDTNPEQWQVVARLTEEFFSGEGARDPVRTVFAVGDEKQSIYSFQRADPAEFVRMRRHFQERAATAQRIWAQVDLDMSFRSTAAVLQAVDAVFALDEARDGVAFEASTVIRHIAFRRGHAGRVEIWPPVAPEDRPDPEPWAPPLARESVDAPSARLASVIAETIRRWVADGEMLESRGRPVRAGDVLVLVRRRTGFVTELVRALKDRAVPVAGVDRMVLTEQLAVMDLMALAEFLLLPEDDLTLATVLKGPLIGFSEDQLFGLAHGRRGRLWSALVARADENPAFGEARAFLAKLLAATGFTRPYELFAGLLAAPCPADAVSGRRAILKRLGPEAQDPLDEFLSVCLAFERVHPPTLQAFLHWLQASEAEIKRELEAGGGHVRIMTVHGSKGLQAPIVFLPDTMGLPSQSPRILWLEEGEAVPLFAARRDHEDVATASVRARANHKRDQEYRRLLYVALTRAEDRLYVCGWHGKRTPDENCWYNLVARALDPLAEPFDFDATGFGSEGWSGPALRLRELQIERPKDDGAGEVQIATAKALPGWWNVPPEAEPMPSRPLTPSKPEGEDPPVRSPLGSDDGAGFRRGILIHRLLQTLPDVAPEHREAACRRFLASPSHQLPDWAQDEIAAETLAVLDHPDFRHLFGPASRAEVPVVGLVGTQAISGQIDRLALTDDAVWIVDYKTNRPPPTEERDVPAVYLRQMALYRQALRAIYPGRAVRCLLLWTDAPRLMELSDGRLAPYEVLMG
ncbi:MAG TPA: double-strand break repair helicase AddA [Azospirillaceae bacterium]|nr:double-strand break repair helicase AddA [Azospirillaceae bacterium]